MKSTGLHVKSAGFHEYELLRNHQVQVFLSKDQPQLVPAKKQSSRGFRSSPNSAQGPWLRVLPEKIRKLRRNISKALQFQSITNCPWVSSHSMPVHRHAKSSTPSKTATLQCLQNASTKIQLHRSALVATCSKKMEWGTSLQPSSSHTHPDRCIHLGLGRHVRPMGSRRPLDPANKLQTLKLSRAVSYSPDIGVTKRQVTQRDMQI